MSRPELVLMILVFAVASVAWFVHLAEDDLVIETYVPTCSEVAQANFAACIDGGAQADMCATALVMGLKACEVGR